MSKKGWREQLALCLHFYSWEDANRMHNFGVITDKVFSRYDRLWHFLQFRFSSGRQEAFYVKYGHEACKAKINKTRKAFGFDPLP